MNWVVKPLPNEEVERLANAVGVSPLLARLLLVRGLGDSEEALRFLHPKIDHLHEPDRMQDLGKAVERLQYAVRKVEKILVYGDYDVDGITASVVVLRALRRLGAEVDCFLPHRIRDGYGMREERIEWAASKGYRVIVSVDTGIREWEVLEKARSLGLECIVVDHHLPGDHLPAAFAVLNPLRADCDYPEKNLAAVGLAFKLAQGLASAKENDEAWNDDLVLAMVGTVADCAPLLGENRVITHFGLQALKRTSILGLQELMRVSDLEEKPVRISDVAFRMAPRINAAGRMEGPDKALELLLTSQPGKARSIAEELNFLNAQRRQTEEKILEEATRQVEARGTALPEALVVAGDRWHRGVIGIVAQRLVERFSRPTFVISLEGGIGHGSGRSVGRFPLVSALDRMSDLFVRYGGHEKAAGVTIPAERLEAFRRSLAQEAGRRADTFERTHTVDVDAEIRFPDISEDLYRETQVLEPCGVGNPQPRFSGRGLKLLGDPRILKKKHLKLSIGQDGVIFEALGWGMAERAKELGRGKAVDLTFRLEENFFRNNYSLQLIIQEIGAIGSQGAGGKGIAHQGIARR